MLGVALAFNACGGDTPLYYYDAPPLPVHSPAQMSEPEDYTPTDYTPPGMSLGLTLENCLGPFLKTLQNAEICPRDTTTNECDPHFQEAMLETKETLEAIVQEQLAADPFDLMDGHVSLPTTALAMGYYHYFMASTLPEQQIVIENRIAEMYVSFGDARLAIRDYMLMRGERLFYAHLNDQYTIVGNDYQINPLNMLSLPDFPVDYLHCYFGQTESTELPGLRKKIHIEYRKTGLAEPLLDMVLRYEHLNDLPETETPTVTLETAGVSYEYTGPETNIDLLSYAIDQIVEEGQDHIKELLRNRMWGYYGILYWDE